MVIHKVYIECFHITYITPFFSRLSAMTETVISKASDYNGVDSRYKINN